MSSPTRSPTDSQASAGRAVHTRGSLWFWRGVWGLGLLVGIGIFLFYAWLPADGATGDLESFRPEGFHIQWLLEEREGGLRVGDVIVRAGGYAADEWLSGAAEGPEWRAGEVVSYEVLREGQLTALSIRLVPVPTTAILARWAPQMLASLALVLVGSFVFWKRPRSLAARLLMLFCVTVAVQLWVDAHNVQYAILPRRWLFWLHLFLEHTTFTLSYASICHFALIFPAPHPLAKRFPRALPLALYASNPLVIALVMALSPTWSQALPAGNQASFWVVVVQLGLAFSAGIRSMRTARDPVSRAQMRWILWGGGLALAVAVPCYVLPIALNVSPLLPHPWIMLLTAVIPYIYAISILRYRLFDIEVIINRTLVYGTLTLLLGGLFLLLVSLLTLAVQEVLHRQDDTLVVFIATLTVVLAFAPLRRRIQTFIDRAFYRTKLDYQQLLREVSARLATSIAPEQLNPLLTQELPQRLQVASVALLVLDPAGEYFVPAGEDIDRAALPVGHPLAVYLHRLGRPLMRLQPSSRVPTEALAFLEQRGVDLTIPLIVGTEMVGLYNLGPKRSGDAFSRDEIDLLHLLGQQIAIAVESSRLLQAAERQAMELAVLHQAAVAVASSLQIEEVLFAVADQLGQALNASSVYICSWDEETSRSTVLAEWISPESEDQESDLGKTYDIQQYPNTLRALLEKRPLIVKATDPGLDPADRGESERYGWQSYLIVPFISRDGVIGYAELWETRWERRFTESEVRLCQTLAADAAVGIERARLFEAERKQRELARALQEAAAVVSSTLDLDQVLDHILEQVAQVVAGDAFNIMLIEGNHSRVVRWRGYEPLGVGDSIAGLSLPVMQYPSLAKMVRTGEPVVVPDVAVDPDWFNLEGWEWLKSYVGAPVRVAGRTVGFLNVDGTRAGQFGSADAQQLQTFADHAATAIENARLFEEAHRRTAYLEAQNAIIAAATGASDLPELLQVTLDHSLEVLGLNAGYIWVADQHATRNISPETGLLIALAAQAGDQGPPAPIIVEDWQQVALEGTLSAAAPIIAQSDIHTSLAVPILTEGRSVGGLILAASMPRPWSSEDVVLVETIGRQLGGAAERLRLLGKTREQAQQVQRIINTVPEGVLLLSAGWRILLVNPTAREYLAVLADAQVGEPLTHLGGRPMEELLSSPEWGLWHEVTGSGPPRRTFEMIAQPLEAGPEAGGWVLLIRDVTQERKIQEQVQQQERLASLGQLAGGIAHDFNNILTIIKLSAETCLFERDLPPRLVSDLESILAAGTRGAHLVRQVLDFSRRSWIETRPVNLQSVVEEVVGILRRTLPENISVLMEAGPGLYIVSADPARIQQVVMNLALNARDAMPDGGELRIGLDCVEVRAGEEPPVAEMPPGEWFCLTISDSGIGIPSEAILHLFEPFYTTKPVGQGTGLGLAQVYGIVKQHQGYIAVDTEVDQGTTFRIYLPIFDVEEEEEAILEEGAEDLPRGLGETILLVEDDEGVRLYCQEILETLGYRVLTAVNGQEALEIFQSAEGIDLLLTDVVMPGMGGRELIAELRMIDPGLKTLAMTGYALRDIYDLQEGGMLEVVQKPVGLHSLARSVRRVLDAR